MLIPRYTKNISNHERLDRRDLKYINNDHFVKEKYLVSLCQQQNITDTKEYMIKWSYFYTQDNFYKEATKIIHNARFYKNFTQTDSIITSTVRKKFILLSDGATNTGEIRGYSPCFSAIKDIQKPHCFLIEWDYPAVLLRMGNGQVYMQTVYNFLSTLQRKE